MGKRHTLRNPDFFGTWLTRILINTCKKYRGRKGRPPGRRTEAQAIPCLRTASSSKTP